MTARAKYFGSFSPAAVNYLCKPVAQHRQPMTPTTHSDWSDKGDLHRAIADFNRAIELDSNLAEAYANRGLMRLRLGQNADAEKDFAESLRLDSSLKPRLEQIVLAEPHGAQASNTGEFLLPETST